jgi:hypothetical protein
VSDCTVTVVLPELRPTSLASLGIVTDDRFK